MSTALKPAVRAETEVNSAASPWCAQPRLPSVRGLLCSTSQITAQPTMISASEPHSVSVAWIDQRACAYRRRASNSLSTGKPRPPTTIASISGPSTQGSAT